jgi:hypothetical protein
LLATAVAKQENNVQNPRKSKLEKVRRLMTSSRTQAPPQEMRLTP